MSWLNAGLATSPTEGEAMPDTSLDTPDAPASPLEVAAVLEAAADIILTRGLRRDGHYGEPGGKRCAVGAVAEACGVAPIGASSLRVPTWRAAQVALYHNKHLPAGCSVTSWNDRTETDDEVRDTLLLVAKDIRNEAAPA